MEVVNFTPAMLDDAGNIALRLWGGEVAEIPETLAPNVYQYLARYYFVPQSDLNFAAFENGKMCGFLMAAVQNDCETRVAAQWLAQRKLDPAEQRLFAEYIAYLDGNRRAEAAAALSGEVLLLFFGSIRRGAGRAMLSGFERRCQAKKLSSMLLWSDETCDFDYYYRHGFTELAKFPSPAGLFGHNFMTCLFRKKI